MVIYNIIYIPVAKTFCVGGEELVAFLVDLGLTFDHVFVYKCE